MELRTNGQAVWNIDIPLAGEGQLRLTRCFGEAQLPTVLVPFAETLHKHLCSEEGGAARRSAAAAAGAG